MNFMIILKRLKNILVVRGKQPKISLLVPFRADTPARTEALRWLRKYWKCALPEAEFIVGFSQRDVFCKTEAFNNAARKARGKVLVLLDADAYIDADTINLCADRILEELDNHLWFVPYRRLYRLTKAATDLILESDPCDPLLVSDPPPLGWVEEDHMDKAGYGHRYGAMVMIIPREALDVIGCFDERFQGWGGEDVALLRALDTLYGKHKTINGPVFHFWHQKIGQTYKERRWEGQESQRGNNNLAMRYHKATGKPDEMRALVDEGCEYRDSHSFINYVISKIRGED